MRINRYIASCSVASRRKCDELIIAGRVRINDKKAELGTLVNDGDIVTVDGKIVSMPHGFIYIILNKPRSFMTTCYDPQKRKTILDLIPKKELGGVRIFPVGRLDYDTEGLLILTNDGEFTRKLSHPTTKIEKTYIAEIDKPITRNHIGQLETGIIIEGELTHPAKAKAITPTTIELKITQGRNRQVRKMFDALGYKILSLKRTAIGRLQLGNLARGKYVISHTKPQI